MARRVPLPRLTQRQRVARWQRERRQQAVYVVAFSAVLFFVLGLAAWGAADRYWNANLRPAARYDGELIAMRDYQRELKYQLIQFYVDFGVPVGSENDPQIDQQKAQYESISLDKVIEYAALERAAAAAGVTISEDAIEQRYLDDFSQYRSRHVLIQVDPNAEDKELADKNAFAKAQAVAAELRAAPNDQDLWNKVAAEKSEDPGSKDSGGELGWVGKGQFVKEFEDAALKLQIGAISDPVKTQFGYHVVQVIERRGPDQNDSVKRYFAAGYTAGDIKAHVRLDLVKDEFAKRAQDALLRSPTEQVHLAQILVNTPTPTAQNLDAFSQGIKKLSELNAELDKGTDFAELAKKYSDDTASGEKGGDIGWFARGMLNDADAEDAIFALKPGERSHPFSTRTETRVYKVLEKDAARALEEPQQTAIKSNAYTLWLAREKKTHDARRLVPGLELE